MQTYQSTPDYYRDYIEHGWLKDQAAKVHKYIKRWRNKAGKWVYQYKKPESHVTLEGKMETKWLTNPGDNYMGAHENWARGAKNKRWKDVENARHNAKVKAKKTSAMKGDSRYKGPGTNLSSRGYANSQTDFNKMVKDGRSIKNSTRGGQAMKNSLEQKSRGVANRNRIKNSRALLKYKPDGKSLTRESVGAREQRIKRIHEEEMTLRAKGWTSRNGILVPPTKNAMMSDPRYKKSKKRRAK